MAPSASIELQRFNLEEIRRLINNFKKDSSKRYSKAYFELKIGALREKWMACEQLHFPIKTGLSHEASLQSDYIKEFEAAEALYEEYMVLFNTRLAEYNAQEAHVPPQADIQTSQAQSDHLERIKIPKFNGTYSDWTAFHDLFKNMIHDNQRLSAVHKMQYLRSSVVGEAEQLIKHLSITADNYASAWKLMCDRYDNKRVIANAFMKLLWEIKPSVPNNAGSIKTMLNISNEVLNSLINLTKNPLDVILVYLLQQKLDCETSLEWQKFIGGSNTIPTIGNFLEFLAERLIILEATKASDKHVKYVVHNTHVNKADLCKVCNNNHKVFQCTQFTSAKVTDRRDLVRKHKLCFNCLSTRHTAIDCTSSKRCRICNGKHNSLLHINVDHEAIDKAHNQTQSLNAVNNQEQSAVLVLLATAMIPVRNASGKFVPLRALIDQGSQRSFITESAVQQLGIKRKNANFLIGGISGVQSATRGMVNVQCKQKTSLDVIQFNVLILNKITGELPQRYVNQSPKISSKELADKTYYKLGKIDMLLGSDIYGQLVLPEMELMHDNLIVQNTKFGWIISGPVMSETATETEVSMEIEESSTQLHLTPEQQECETHYMQTTRRNIDDGRYIVRLPFKPDCNAAKELAPSLTDALYRWQHIEKRLEQNDQLKVQYHAFLEEYLKLGHMEEIPVNEIQGCSSYYIPHHAVIKESSTTTKVRVVFDASHRTSSGFSLNDCLMVGPTIQANIVNILLRWRLHRVALTGDIEKMYRQILVDCKDRDYLRIVWRPKAPGPIKHYRLKTITYGTACAPYQAIKTLQRLALDEQFNHPVATSVVLNDFYVDDLLTGSDTIDQATALQRNVTRLLESGGFKIRKWSSNYAEVLKTILPEDRAMPGPIELNMENTVKTLGVLWNPQLDVFTFKVSLPILGEQKVTKRLVASSIAKLFDPLGWLQPSIIIGKILLQKLWLLKINWDDPLPQETISVWKDFMIDCQRFENIHIPRFLGTSKSSKIELHGFCDASMDAFSAVVYLKTIDLHNNVHVHLLTSKAKVCPLKVQSIPRLELCGAVLLCKLMKQVKESLDIPQDVKTLYWTDSTIVLSWLSDHPSKWKTYVANRVSEIHSCSESYQWKHVATEHNPADLASRGIPPSKLVAHELWWTGPPWLKTTTLSYKSEVESTMDERELAENRKIQVNIVADPSMSLLSRYSDYNKLLRVVAYCLRFKYRSKKPEFVSSEELLRARGVCVRMSQQAYYADELKKLKEGKVISTSSKILALSPYLDSYGIMRTYGRLNNAEINDSSKNQIIISPNCKLAELIVRAFHYKTLHGSNIVMTAAIRTEFWIPQCQKLVKTCIHKCIKCFKMNAQSQKQFMGNLPKVRVTPAKAFSNCGLDFAGPISVKWSSGRGAKTAKSYIAVFVCLSTKAMHLEVVSDLTSKACIAAIKRFVARRGLCKNIYSDCGTNFVGANKELKHQFELARQQTQSHLAGEQINWHFNPPSSPHFGGLWEAGVKSIKVHLIKTIGTTLLNMEELYTVLTQVEAVLNSRPLTPISNDINDEEALTPGHFLIGQPLIAVPQGALSEKLTLSERWQLTTKMVEHFWHRWTSQYLSRLQQRPKWLKPETNLQPGQLVLIKGENYPPMKWPLARILEIHPGNYGMVRVVTIKLRGHTTKRAVTKLCPLPVPLPDVETMPSEREQSRLKAQRETAKHEEEQASKLTRAVKALAVESDRSQEKGKQNKRIKTC